MNKTYTVIYFYFAWNYFLRFSRHDREREIIFPPNIVHHTSILGSKGCDCRSAVNLGYVI